MTLQTHLAQAEWHVKEGLRHIEKQRALVKKLDSDGHDTELAEDFLCRLLDCQNTHEWGLRRLLREVRELKE